jgi:RimJ/RimL family protein N-acetyltransferase
MYLQYKQIQDTIADREALYALRNEPRDLYWSGYIQAHSIESFTAWYKQQLQRKDRVIWLISYMDNTVLGYLYLNKLQEEQITIAELSIGISEHHKGKGLGTLAINFLVDYCKNIGIKVIRAWIVEENIASIKSFIKSGFSPTTITKKVYYESFGKELILRQYDTH